MRRALLVMAAITLAGVPSAARATEQLVDGIAAQVGDQVVLISEVMTMVASAEAQMRAQGAPDIEIAKLRADGLERMIEWRLIENVVRQAELFATDEEIDKTIEAIASENGISMDQVEASVTAHGLDYADYRDQIKREIERRKVVNAMVGSQIHIDEQEVRDLYQKRFAEQPAGGTVVHIRQILVADGKEAGRSEETACQMVEKARARIVAGEKFGLVASQVSDVARARGGDIGSIHENTVAPWMGAILKKLEPGQMSGVEKLPFGCTLLELVSREEYTPVTFEQARPRLEQEIYEKKLDEGYRKWMEELRANTYIERKGHFADGTVLSTASGASTGP
jgi:peptidyl-prolyl cis-trans isomerase SurA